MERSRKGLQGEGEWSALRKISPDFTGKNVLDLGCGYGWHCKYAAEAGAEYILGTDIYHKMLKKAKKENKHEKIKYQCIPMEDQKGFLIQYVIELQLSEEMMDMHGMKDEMRRSIMLLVSAMKIA